MTYDPFENLPYIETMTGEAARMRDWCRQHPIPKCKLHYTQRLALFRFGERLIRRNLSMATKGVTIAAQDRWLRTFGIMTSAYWNESNRYRNFYDQNVLGRILVRVDLDEVDIVTRLFKDFPEVVLAVCTPMEIISEECGTILLEHDPTHTFPDVGRLADGVDLLYRKTLTCVYKIAPLPRTAIYNVNLKEVVEEDHLNDVPSVLESVEANHDNDGCVIWVNLQEILFERYFLAYRNKAALVRNVTYPESAFKTTHWEGKTPFLGKCLYATMIRSDEPLPLTNKNMSKMFTRAKVGNFTRLGLRKGLRGVCMVRRHATGDAETLKNVEAHFIKHYAELGDCGFPGFKTKTYEQLKEDSDLILLGSVWILAALDFPPSFFEDIPRLEKMIPLEATDSAMSWSNKV